MSALGLQVADARHAQGDTKRAAAKRGERAIGIRGLNRDLPIRFAPETGAVPGERIVGILTPGEGITIYPIFARSLQNYDDEPDRWVDLTWDTLDDGQFYPARIMVVIHNEVGALAQVSGVIGDNGGNIDNLQMVTRAQDFYDLEIVLEVHDVKHLNRIMQDLRLKPLVSSVVRMTG